ncbi:MAG: recombination mediator RecR [Bacillota bacterium]
MELSIQKLANEFSKLPGVGKRTALRFAYRVVEMDKSDVESLIFALSDVKENVSHCEICGNFCEGNICSICENRAEDVICVVKDPKDIMAIENMGSFGFRYHVLFGTISPLKNIAPDDLKIRELLSRAVEASEVILALPSDVEGDATGVYIAKLLKPLGIKVTRISQGISIGQDIEYADQITLQRAFSDRREF